MKTISYNIPNISCQHCVHTITTELMDLPGVKSVEANRDTKLVTIHFEEPATEEQLVSLLAEIDYPVAA